MEFIFKNKDLKLSDQLIIEAIWTLNNLYSQSDFDFQPSLQANPGMIQQLIGYMSSSNPELSAISALLLANIFTCSEESRAEFISLGQMSKLKQLIMSEKDANNLATYYWLLSVLCLSSSNKELCTEIPGFFPLMEQILNAQNNFELLQLVVTALMNLTNTNSQQLIS